METIKDERAVWVELPVLSGSQIRRVLVGFVVSVLHSGLFFSRTLSGHLLQPNRIEALSFRKILAIQQNSNTAEND